MIELQWTEVDGVTTIWTDAPPPLRACLFFRTGKADETLVTSGQTHLIEHLALSTANYTPQRDNGFVAGVVTGFFTMGQAQEVSGFFARICKALVSLPGDRLESEKQILRAENAARQYNFSLNLLTMRYGARGYGLQEMRELGLQTATIEQLCTFSVQRFTNENAILWLSGPPPSDLHLDLPHGIKQPLPSLSPIQTTFPSWFVDNDCGGVAAGATITRDSAMPIFLEIAGKRLRERLRTEKAVSYAPMIGYDPLSSDTAHLVLYADSDKDHRRELASTFGEVFEGLGKVDETEVEAARQQIIERWTGSLAPPLADRILGEVQRAAMEWILGIEFEPLEEYETKLLSVTASDVSKIGRDVQATAMFALPGEAAIQPWIGENVPFSTGPAVRGRETLSIDVPVKRERLVDGPDGVSILFPDGSQGTVRYSELAAALYYEDGCIHLIGSNARALIIEPTLWRDGQSVCRSIRERVPAYLLLAQGSRSVNDIPKPKTTARQRFLANLGMNPSKLSKPASLVQVSSNSTISNSSAISEWVKKGQDEFYKGEYQKSQNYFNMALTISRNAGDRAEEVTTLNGIGEFYMSQKHYLRASKSFDMALDIARKTKDRAREVTLLNNVGKVDLYQRNYDQALKTYNQALKVSREAGDRAGEIMSLNNIGTLYDNQGKYDQALIFYNQALEISREIGNQAMEGKLLDSIGQMYQGMRQYDQALKSYDQALMISREVGDRAREGNLLTNMGVIYFSKGQSDQALNYYDQSLVISREIGNRAVEGPTLVNIGAIYMSQGQHELALDYLKQSLVINREIGDRSSERMSLANLGMIYRDLGQYDQALNFYDQALTLNRKIKDRAGEAFILNGLGSAYQGTGQFDQAISCYNQALKISREIGDRAGEGAALYGIGTVYLDQTQYDDALNCLVQALSINREVGNRAGEGNTLFKIGRVYQEKGQFDQALEFYNLVLGIARDLGNKDLEQKTLEEIEKLPDN